MSKLENIKDCKLGHCRFHFPQFKKFREEELKRTIEKVLLEDDKSYYHKSYKNWEELNEKYNEIYSLIDENFIQACELLMSLENSYIRHHLYLDCQGGVAEFQTCCR